MKLDALSLAALAVTALLLPPRAHAVTTNVALNRPVVVDSTLDRYFGANAVDGVISDTSRWVSADTAGPHTLEVDLGAPVALICAHLHTGYGADNPMANARLQAWSGSGWVDIAGGSLSANAAVNLLLLFDAPVTTSRVRLFITDSGKARVKELKLFNESLGGCPALSTDPNQTAGGKSPKTDILINLSGYNLDKPKRFTAPLLAHGTAFSITRVGQNTVLFSGLINNNIGDFSAFNPTDTGEYVIRAGTKISYPFSIGPNWLERIAYGPAINFMRDARCYGGTSNSCQGGLAWRDSGQFSFEVSSLVQMYAANPSAFDRMPREWVYSFNSKLQTLAAPAANAPDIVKMIHWGVDRIVKAGSGVTGTHPLFKGELAAFLAAYPQLQGHISQADYIRVRDYAFAKWSDLGLGTVDVYELNPPPTGDMFQTYKVVGTGKGEFPPGHSIAPNLQMYEVALREGRPEAPLFLNAAYNQTQWLIANLDWNDPVTTKGQRMSEHKTMEGLAYFQQAFPDLAPPGLLGKINAWVDVVIARSANLWDFRKYSATQWIIPSYNEPGNVLGFPAAALAAAQVIADPAKQQRLREIAFAQFDAGFGRNPLGRHFSYDAPSDFEGVETGWTKFFNGGYGQLVNARGVIEGSPKESAYPFNPSADSGYTEGWVAFNTAFNASLAYMAKDDTAVRVFDPGFTAPSTSVGYGQIGLELQAPLNFNYAAVESGTVSVISSNGDVERLTVTEAGNSSVRFRATATLSNAGAVPNDGVIQVPPGGWFEVAYGDSIFKKKLRFQSSGGLVFIRQ